MSEDGCRMSAVGCRKTANALTLPLVPTVLPTSVFRHPTADIRLPSSATQFAAPLVGIVPYPPPVPKRGDRYGASALCWLCGGETGGVGWPRDAALPSTFASHNEAAVSSSDAVCQPCAAFAVGATWQPVAARLGLKTWQQASWRSYSHLFAAPSQHECPGPHRWREILLEPPRPPFVLIISLSAQKNLVFRALVAHSRDTFPVLMETERLIVERRQFRRCLTDVEAARAAGAGRESILTGRWHPAAMAKMGPPLFRTTDGIIKRWRRTEPQLLQLATHVSRRPQTEQTKRPEQPVPPPATVSTPTTNMRQLELF